MSRQKRLRKKLFFPVFVSLGGKNCVVDVLQVHYLNGKFIRVYFQIDSEKAFVKASKASKASTKLIFNLYCSRRTKAGCSTTSAFIFLFNLTYSTVMNEGENSLTRFRKI